MSQDHQKLLKKYADLIIKSGLNIQPGQRLIMTNISFGSGVALEAAPLVRNLVASAYHAGARYVEVLWDDRETQRALYAKRARAGGAGRDLHGAPPGCTTSTRPLSNARGRPAANQVVDASGRFRGGQPLLRRLKRRSPLPVGGAQRRDRHGHGDHRHLLAPRKCGKQSRGIQ